MSVGGWGRALRILAQQHRPSHGRGRRISSHSRSNDDVREAVDAVVRLANDRKVSVAEVWGAYDRLRMRRLVQYLPFEAWEELLKTCQRATDPNVGPAANGPAASSSAAAKTRRFPVRSREGEPSAFAREFAGRSAQFWTAAMARRRALLMLGDMQGAARTKHYNIVLDVVSRDSAASADDLAALHSDMRMRGVGEDTVTFNTLLNGCRRLHAWQRFGDTAAHMRERDAWGVTLMDATTWGTLVQGHADNADWPAVDRCLAEIEAAATAERPAFAHTTQLWATVVSAYAARGMVAQMLAARATAQRLGLVLNAHVFSPVFAALHRWRRRLARAGRSTRPAVEAALAEVGAMRAAAARPNVVMLTSIVLTVGLGGGAPSATQAALCEELMACADDADAHAALLNVAGQAGGRDDVRALWAQMGAAAAPPVGPLVTPRTLAAYINALAA
ncbi:hypothetical protein GGF37_006078, partial [Kickxella alabastrina]